MSGRWAVGSIAGVAIQDAGGRNARTSVLDGEQLRSNFVGSTVVALDFTVHTQLADHGTKGVHYGAHINQLPIAKLNSILTAINAALAANTPFTVVLTDASSTGGKVDDLSLASLPDFQASGGKLFTRGALSNIYVKDLVFRFISTA